MTHHDIIRIPEHLGRGAMDNSLARLLRRQRRQYIALAVVLGGVGVALTIIIITHFIIL